MKLRPHHWLLEKAYLIGFHGKWDESPTPINLEGIRKILVIRNDNIGDVVCTTPLLRNLRQAFPKAFLAVLVCRLTQEVVEGNPDIDQVFIYDKAKHGRYRSPWVAWWKQFQVLLRLRRLGFDLVLGVRSEFSSPQAWMAFFTGAPWRIGRQPKSRDQKFAFFYTHFLESPGKNMHEVERSLEFLKPLGIKAAFEKLSMDIPVSSQEALAHLVTPNEPSKQLRRIGLHLTSRMEEGKYWDDQNYINLSHRINGLPQTDLFFSYGPDQVQTAQRILPHLPPGVKTLLTENLKTFGAYAKALELLITIEGGPMHLAAAVGIPLLALYGKTDPAVWYPWGVPFKALRQGRQENLITVDEVFREIQTFFDRHPSWGTDR